MGGVRGVVLSLPATPVCFNSSDLEMGETHVPYTIGPGGRGKHTVGGNITISYQKERRTLLLGVVLY